MKKVLLFLVIACGLSVGAVEASPDASASPQPADKATRCEPVTGSRIARAPDVQGLCDSKAGFVRSYGEDDLRRTDEIDLDAALAKLDPALTRGGAAGGFGATR